MRLSDPIELKRSIAASNIIGDGKTLEELIDEQPDAQLAQDLHGACTDSISRQAAIDALRTMQTYKLCAGDELILIDKAEAQTELMMLPAAQPQRKKGSWVCIDGINYECDQCGCVLEDWIQGAFYNYCPACGTDMRENINV